VPQNLRTQLRFPRLSSVVKKLLYALTGCYVAQLVLQNWLGWNVVSLLALRPGRLQPWQLVTYVLVDAGHPMMFLFGLLFLWWALSPFEIAYGPLRVLQLTLCCMLGASVPADLVGFALPDSPPLYGSSALWFGGIAATSWLYHDQQMSLFGMLQLSGRQFLWLLLAMSGLSFLFDKDHTQLVASLGAMGAAVAFTRFMKRPRKPQATRKPSGRPRGFKVIQGGGGNDDGRPKWLN
jgi:membrane associated rhomboid family serine protease